MAGVYRVLQRTLQVPKNCKCTFAIQIFARFLQFLVSCNSQLIIDHRKMSPTSKTSEQLLRRQRVSDLLRSQVKYTDISRIVGVSLRTIANVRQRIDAGAGLEEPSHGGQNKILTKKFLKGLEKAFKANPFQSLRSVARKRQICTPTVLRGLKKIHMESRVRPHRQFLSAATQYTRIMKSKKLLSKLKKKSGDTVVIFSDKKLFTLDQGYNRRNSRAVVPTGSTPPPIGRTKHPQKVMTLGIIASDGKKCPPYFFPQGLKITSKVYIDVLKKHVIPWLKRTYPRGNYVFQQDSAPAHKAKITQKFMDDNFAEYWPCGLWPPSSPDCNPLDYAIWGVMQTKVGATPHRNTTALKSAIRREWAALSAQYIAKSCKRFRARIEAVVKANGGHIEK